MINRKVEVITFIVCIGIFCIILIMEKEKNITLYKDSLELKPISKLSNHAAIELKEINTESIWGLKKKKQKDIVEKKKEVKVEKVLEDKTITINGKKYTYYGLVKNNSKEEVLFLDENQDFSQFIRLQKGDILDKRLQIIAIDKFKIEFIDLVEDKSLIMDLGFIDLNDYKSKGKQ